MPVSKQLGSYSDMPPVLDKVIKAGGGRLTLPTKGKAINWRQRAHKFRKLSQEKGIEKYDNLVFELDEEVVVMKIRQPYQELTTLDGKKLKLDDGLEAEAEKLASLIDEGDIV